MNSLSFSHADSGHLEVVREVDLEVGQVVEPHAIAQTREGGYVVAGASHEIPWATRTDATGVVQWRYLRNTAPPEPAPSAANYEGVTVLANDSTLLCGWKKNEHYAVSGLLTHLDKAGQVIGERILVPNMPGETLHQNYLVKCLSWGDGVAVVGRTVREGGGGAQHPQVDHLTWILALDGKANIKWEKVYPFSFGFGDDALITSDQDLVIDSAGGRIVTRIDPTGAVKAQSQFFGALVRPTQSEVEIYALSYPKDRTVLQKLGGQLEDLGRVTGKKVETIHSKVVYRLLDGSIALFGNEEGTTKRAAVSWISPDLNKLETLVFRTGFWTVWDAIPTGKPGEFVTVRQIVPQGRSSDPKEFGMGMAFVRVK